MKEIAFVMPWLLPMPPVRGGAVETLVDGLLQQNERERALRITVFTPDDEQARGQYARYAYTKFVPIRVSRASEEAARLWRGGMSKLFHYRVPSGCAYLHAVCRALRGSRFDAILCENVAPFASAIAKTRAGEVYLHMHNVVHPSELENPARVAACCKRVVTVSDYISRWARENLSASEEQCRVLLNCVDAERFREGRSRREAVRASLGIEARALVFLYAGRICPEKGALELARAFREANLPDARLVFVGSKWFGETTEDGYLQKIKQTLEPIREQVRFTGYVAYADMPAQYAVADVAVFPAIWEEPGSLTLLEAQAAGIPVISTVSGGNAQNVCPQGAILLERGEGFERRLADTMRELAGDEARRAAMSEAALRWSADRGMARYYRDFLRVLDA